MSRTVFSGILGTALAVLICVVLVQNSLHEQASNRLKRELYAIQSFLHDEHSAYVTDPDQLHIDYKTLANSDDLHITLFTVVSPEIHSLVAVVDGEEHTIDSHEHVVGHVSRITVVIDRFDNRLKATLSGFLYDRSVTEDLGATVSLDSVEHPYSLGSLVYPELGVNGGTQGSEECFDKPTLLFRWSGQHEITVHANFRP